MEKASIDWYSMSDKGVLNLIGQFIQETRLQQNKTQQQVADSAGINRSTVGQIENVLKQWPDYANQCDVETVLQKAIAETFVQL